MRTTSMRSFDEPCGSWHVVQFSRTGACSHRIGPRISVWQLVQLSTTELPTFSALTLLMEPCGLWHDEQDILPSRTGMCATARSVLIDLQAMAGRAHLRLGCLDQLAFCGLGLCTLWHVVHDRLRPRACCLPIRRASPRLWQVRQVWLTSAGFICPNFRMCPFASSSTCACPGPWQLSQPWSPRACADSSPGRVASP